MNGNAEATFMLACRDNRGALSDTLVQFIPLQNFPPVVNFQSDFDPLINMQREFLDADGNVTETPGRRRHHLLELGRHATSGCSPWTSTARPPWTTVLPLHPGRRRTRQHLGRGRPAADPETGWVRVPFYGSDEVKEFDDLHEGGQPGQARTLTVSVTDEADAETRLPVHLGSAGPPGPVLYIPDNSTPLDQAVLPGFLDERIGPGNWDDYDFWFGFPDERIHPAGNHAQVRAGDLDRRRDATSNILDERPGRDGVLDQYVMPTGRFGSGAAVAR